MVVERQFLRIAKSRMDDFQAATIRPAAENGPAPGRREHRSLGSGHMKAAIADGKIEPAVGAPRQTVQVMAEERGVHPKAFQQHLAVVGFAVPVAVAKAPQSRDAGEPDGAVAGGQAGRQAVEHAVETVRVHGGSVGAAVAIAIFQQPHLVGVPSEPIPAAGELLEMLAIHREAIGERTDLKIVFQQKGAGPILLGALVESILFGDVHAIAFVEAEGHRVAERRFGGEEFDPHSRRNSQRGEIAFGRRRSVRQRIGCARWAAAEERRLRLDGEGRGADDRQHQGHDE